MVMLLIMLSLILCTNIMHYHYRINADIASEGILARLIWESGEWIPSTWCVAMETRIFDIANLAAGNVKKGVNIGGIVGGLIDWSPLNIKQLRTNINAVGTIVATAPGKLIGFYIYLASNTSETHMMIIMYNVSLT